MIPDLELETILNENAQLFERMAFSTMGKLRKPTNYDIEDLIQEAKMACIKAVKSFEPNKGATLNTWINSVMRNHLYDIVWYSYRKAVTINTEDFSFFQGAEDSQESEVDVLDFVKHKFSLLEKKYIDLCILERKLSCDMSSLR